MLNEEETRNGGVEEFIQAALAASRESLGRSLAPGKLLEGTQIACDMWLKRRSGFRLHFLSHAHSDHMNGLGPDFPQPIHCSPVTAKLLANAFAFPKAALRPLELGVPHHVLSTTPVFLQSKGNGG